MSWLKRHEPIILSQSSDIPYIITEKGVFLCFDNLYTEQLDTSSEHYIRFAAYKNDFFQQSTNHFKLRDFPKLIPFEEIVQLDDTIIEGRVIKQAASIEEKHDSFKIAIAYSEFIRELEDDNFQEFVENLDNYDRSFLLIDEEIDPQSRLLEDDMDIIHHRGWYPTLVTIADRICSLPNRKYCWIHSLPILLFTVYGLQDTDDMNEICENLDNIGIQEKEVEWG